MYCMYCKQFFSSSSRDSYSSFYNPTFESYITVCLVETCAIQHRFFLSIQPQFLEFVLIANIVRNDGFLFRYFYFSLLGPFFSSKISIHLAEF